MLLNLGGGALGELNRIAESDRLNDPVRKAPDLVQGGPNGQQMYPWWGNPGAPLEGTASRLGGRGCGDTLTWLVSEIKTGPPGGSILQA